MPSLKSQGFPNPQYMPGNGTGMILVDQVAVAANFTVADVVDFRIPAGMELTTIELDATRIDTNGAPTLAFQAGYAPIQAGSQYAASLTYFAPASAIIVGRAVNGALANRCSLSFAPIKFEEDVMLRLTCNAVAATFAAGTLRAILHGVARGVS